MWIKLLQPVTGLFFPSETLRAGTVVSIGDPKGRKLVGQGKAIQHVFPASDPDDVEGLRERYRQANGPLWDDERRRSGPSGSPPQAVTAVAALNFDARVQQLLGPRSVKYWRRRQAKARLEDNVVNVNTSKLKTAAKRLAAGRSVTRPSITIPNR